VDVLGLYELYGEEVLGYLRRRARAGDAEEVESDVWLRVVQHADRHGLDLENPRAWLYAVARSALADYYRARARDARETALDSLLWGSRAEEPVEVALARERLREVMARIDRLSTDQRTVMGLCVEEGLRYAEAGRRTGRTWRAVQSIIFRARVILRGGSG
jgi:RNA polymerase sigma-70 factor, ECF subfamily